MSICIQENTQLVLLFFQIKFDFEINFGSDSDKIIQHKQETFSNVKSH